MPGKSAAKLAKAVREERMEFDDALLDYLLANHPERMGVSEQSADTAVSFFWTLKIVISYASMGHWDKKIPLSDTEESTVREIIDTFGLEPFVEPSGPEERS